MNNLSKEQSLVLELFDGKGSLLCYPSSTVDISDASGGFNDVFSVSCLSPMIDATMKGGYDNIVSIAATHHLGIVERDYITKGVVKNLKRDGTYIIADVITGSYVAKFLTEFIGKHNQVGHDCLYLSGEDVCRLDSFGFIVNVKLLNYHWEFDSKKEMLREVRETFFIDAGDSEILEALEYYLALQKLEGGGFKFNWQLAALICTNKED